MRLAVISFCLLLLAACTNDGGVPRDIIGRDEMGKILWDVIQADQFSTIYLAKDSSKTNVKAETMKLYEEVFRLHHITREEFQKSYQYYLSHPDISKVMFDSLSARASKRRPEIYQHPPKLKVK